MRSKLHFYIALFSMLLFLAGTCPAQAMNLAAAEFPGLTDIGNQGTLPEITGTAAILIDADSGQVLYEKNAHDRRFPASTTKIMTALLAIENLDMEAVITADAEAASMTGSRIHLAEGEQVKTLDLLYALMVESANDSAVALGKAVSGTVTDFAALMTKRAAEVGALNTQFTNTNGLPDENHYTTAYDLAMITKAAFAHQLFREVAATPAYTIPATNLREAREMKNSNLMLWDDEVRTDENGTQYMLKYEGTNGVKTGHTNAAGYCLVASVNRDGHELIGVVLGAAEWMHFSDMHRIMDYGFGAYDSVVLVGTESLDKKVKVKRGELRKIPVILKKDLRVSLPAGTEPEKVEVELTLEKKYEAPVAQNQTLGKAEIFYNGKLLTTENVVAGQESPLREGIDIVGILLAVLKYGGIGAAILIVLYALFAFGVNRIYQRKKKKRK